MNDVLTSLVEHRDGNVTRVTLNGEPYMNGVIDAVIADYNEITGTPRPQTDDFNVGDKVSILVASQGNFGHRAICTQPGTVFAGQRGLGLLPKGSRRNGLSLASMLDGGRVLDVAPTYKGEAVLAEKVATVRRHFPETQALTQSLLKDLPTRGNKIRLVLFGTYPFMGQQAVGCLWLCHSYMSDADILESVLIIRPEFGESEHGSAYGQDMLNMRSIGAVVNPPEMTFAEALELTNVDYGEALARIVGGAQ